MLTGISILWNAIPWLAEWRFLFELMRLEPLILNLYTIFMQVRAVLRGTCQPSSIVLSPLDSPLPNVGGK